MKQINCNLIKTRNNNRINNNRRNNNRINNNRINNNRINNNRINNNRRNDNRRNNNRRIVIYIFFCYNDIIKKLILLQYIDII
jgi:hypothetical protein